MTLDASARMGILLSKNRLSAAFLAMLAAGSLVGCVRPPEPPPLAPLPSVSASAGMASIRQDGSVGRTTSLGSNNVSYGIAGTSASSPVETPISSIGATGAPVTLDFADTDIRAVAAQILGAILHASYTIDPAVHGTVSLHTSTPVSYDQLLPTLEVLLAQVNATLVSDGALYRIVPSSVGNSSGLASGPDATGSEIIPLHYVSADDLVRVLQPYASQGTRVAAAPGGNAVLLAGDPTSRAALAGLIAAFDVDSLAGQSFALFPVDTGSAKDMATALQQAIQPGSSSGARGQTSSEPAVRVIPMERINAVLVTAGNESAIAAAQRIFSLIRHRQDRTTRSWSVYYLQNGQSNDVAYILQQAFTPDHITAEPTPTATVQSMTGNTQSGSASSGINGMGSGGLGSGGVGGIGGGSLGGLGSSGGGLGSGASGGSGSSSSGTSSSSGNPLLGGLDAASGGASSDEMRIIPDSQNNALLIYGTPQEVSTVQATLRKIDIIPLQVRIDAVIAEVQLNDALRYGTQFFFKAGGLNGTLTSVFNATNSFNGYFLAGSNASQVALDMLQAVSTVHVLSSPELMVLDNQPARLEVGDLVPYLTSQSQSTLTSTSEIINSVSYEQTGVILEVTPRVSSDGLVTLDIAQEVSNVNTSATSTSSTTSINSPTFTQRDVQSRVVVQDGQTIGLAGLIQDSVTRSNQGVPFVKDIPVIGALFGQQNNTRTRDELLVLITPHVIHDQRDALDLTQDLREQLPNAAAVPQVLQQLPLSGSDDPTAPIRRHFGSP
jgi:general secretion pathway protein D